MSIIRNGIESADLDVPVVLPTLNLDFANSQNLDDRITFSRGSIGTFVNKNGLIETAAANIPRFDYDPISGECKGLLIEESRQNIALQSENINTSPWGTSSLTFAPNSIIAPDGNLTADKLIENPSFSSFKTTAQSVGTISGTYTISAFFKAGERFRGYLQLFGGGNATAFFNLKTGTITGGSGTNTIIPYGNGWYRVSSTATFTSAVAAIYIVVLRDDGTAAYTGDGTSGLYCWGAQLEAGAFPTSYIPTSGSTVTRSADNASMTGTNFSSWYNQTEGTLYARWSYPFTPSGFPGITNLRDSASQNSIYITTNLFNHNRFGASGSNVSIFDVQGANAVRANIPSSSVITYNTNSLRTDISYSGDGSIARLTKNIPIVNIDRLVFGNNLFNILSGHIRRVTYYPRALSPAQLQYITS